LLSGLALPGVIGCSGQAEVTSTPTAQAADSTEESADAQSARTREVNPVDPSTDPNAYLETDSPSSAEYFRGTPIRGALYAPTIEQWQKYSGLLPGTGELPAVVVVSLEYAGPIVYEDARRGPPPEAGQPRRPPPTGRYTVSAYFISDNRPAGFGTSVEPIDVSALGLPVATFG